ncbi:hypothetical protein PBY51_023749 [Eleginops maclovinus]|uniref:Uncharacterized protein n=1 Tax=Eleginops maclovinus TaxID=56733 RepID=A0AAN8AEM5_ELEMC|nr:hypothetical protein PBY51_023749 [Eleginops maclovinus]
MQSSAPTSHPVMEDLSPFRAAGTPCVLCSRSPSKTKSSTPQSSPCSPPLPAAQFSFFNQEQTNKTLQGNEATSGNRHGERSHAY